jgi:bleomycin hydrolase
VKIHFNKRNNKTKRPQQIQEHTPLENTKVIPPNPNAISDSFIKECEDEFNNDPVNIIGRNAVVSIGSMIATINSKRLNEIDYIFLNSIKKKCTKSTNQGRSGRCWMFSGLNMFRHFVIKALNMNNFEFSETYLFFWDKFERSNSYLRWFIDNPTVKIGDRSFDYMTSGSMGDGGWWNMFANLVEKYGLVPKNAMKETFQSGQSDDMNAILEEHLQACSNHIYQLRKTSKNVSNETLEQIKNDCLKQIYNILVKFLGDPPKNFKMNCADEADNQMIIDKMNAIDLKNMVVSNTIKATTRALDLESNMNDFVVLCNVPKYFEYNKIYEINLTNNVFEGKNCQLLNLPMNEITKYVSKSVLSGMPVWFAADVSKDFNPYHSTLDDQLVNNELVFGKPHPFEKGDRILFNNVSANHAMTIIGLNVDQKGTPVCWQVENSWGYWDNETPGEDGFLYMSQSWFEKYGMQVVIHKKYLSRRILKMLNQKPIIFNPWESVAPALRVKPVDAPLIYDKIASEKLKKV